MRVPFYHQNFRKKVITPGEGVANHQVESDITKKNVKFLKVSKFWKYDVFKKSILWANFEKVFVFLTGHPGWHDPGAMLSL